MYRFILSSVIFFWMSCMSYVDAHGYITVPETTFKPGTSMKTSYVGLFNAIFNGKFDGSPDDNSNNFLRGFAASNYKTLRDLVQDKGPECGSTDPNASPKPIPSDNTIVWQNPDTGEGFVHSHAGPCEVWLNENRVFYDENCARHFTGTPARIRIDFSSCNSGCLLRFYWLALHEPNWQVYKNCIPLAGRSYLRTLYEGEAQYTSQPSPAACETAPEQQVTDVAQLNSYNSSP